MPIPTTVDRHRLIELCAEVLEGVGVAVLVVSAVVALVGALKVGRRRSFGAAYEHFRVLLGRGILLGLEFLVAADIIRTVTSKLALERVMVLGLVVFIRTFLSLALEIELEGRLPWHRYRKPRRRKEGTEGVAQRGKAPQES